jgi:hypothetical protein
LRRSKSTRHGDRPEGVALVEQFVGKREWRLTQISDASINHPAVRAARFSWKAGDPGAWPPLIPVADDDTDPLA